ncbi:hypothetical protein [Xylanibacter ruminicola]|uniref:Uncharacterized protein n=1 Tax=Xylanibacter ruminicola TaxID=839 RepID=A0A1M6VGZ5_XYLRU|nr:hypothetical protein [Xylanibacter ruminicola]SHK80624.1 hypothetical protein SAMN05216463_112113 [Xylanibacter ruminicola]
MNKSIKIILLVVAILLAVGGVMAYYKTRVSPPRMLEFKNQYVNSDKKDITLVKSAKTDNALDSVFVVITHELDLQLADSFITNKEKDELLELFATQYVPSFVSACKSKFSKSVWNEGELQNINSRISELQGLVTTEKKIVIKGEANTSLNEVHNVIVAYYEAKNVASTSGYNGLQAAKQKIATAKRFASMSPINNCTDLVLRLNSVPNRLEQAHYTYLVSQVERLRHYYNYNQDDFDKMALDISEKLEEYKKNAKSTYGRVSDISSLESRAGNYYSNATFN